MSASAPGAALSRGRLPHLFRRQGTYHLRVRVPDALRERVGVVEVRRSLGTNRQPEAALLALKLVARLKGVFRMAIVEDLSKTRTRELVQECFLGLKQRVDAGYRLRTADVDLELQEQEALSLEHISDLQDQITGQSFGGVVVAEGRHLAKVNSIDLEALSYRTCSSKAMV